MQKQTKLTLTGLIIVILLIAFVMMIGIPFMANIKRSSMRVFCATNLKCLGTAITVYANDYNDNYPQLPGRGPWAKDLGFPYYHEQPDFVLAQSKTPRTISASWYLLVRECDVAPKSFLCPYSKETEFFGENPGNLPLEKLWDFGPDPYKHVSYAYHNPYGQFPPDGSRSAAFAIAADMNPWFKNGSIIPSGKNDTPPQIVTIPPEFLQVPKKIDDSLYYEMKQKWKLSNSINELPYTGPLQKKAKVAEGQNVLFADGYASFEKQPNVGVKNDNIYTFWSTDENPTEQDKQGGTAPTSRNPENNAKSADDSFLAI